MTDKKVADLILKKILEQVTPSDEESRLIENELKKFLVKIKHNIAKLKINAEVFVGGSFAKKTMIKKDEYDVDIFLRFDKRYKNEDLTRLTNKILNSIKKTRIHGSRDYFEVKINSALVFEIIPVRKIKNPKDAGNITDLSYSHVKYINKKIKNVKVLEEIKIAKAFCYANKIYGAESHIGGFSGYALELLILHYKNFQNMLKKLCMGRGKIVIDIEKQFKNKNQVLMDLNASKLNSPIILVDPTFKHRNVLAALSEETFKRFQKIAGNFLKNPNISFFVPHKSNLEKIEKNSVKKGFEFQQLILETDKQRGGIAGSKLKKFYLHLGKEVGKFFDLKDSGFEYSGKKDAICFFVAKKKNGLLIMGPKISQKESVKKFKKAHNKTFSKNGRIYVKKKINFNLRQFLEKWIDKNKKKVKDMSISEIRIND